MLQESPATDTTIHRDIKDPEIGVLAVDRAVPQVGPATKLETLMAYFTARPAVLIVSDGRLRGIRTTIDILDYLVSRARTP